MTKTQQLVERVWVTFVESAFAYVIVLPNPTLSKTVIAGAVGAGLSAVYNLLRQSRPTVPDQISTPKPVVYTVPPGIQMNGVSQLTEITPTQAPDTPPQDNATPSA